MAILTPYIPTYITVHLGAPSAQAENVTLSFHDYVKNVACSEIYPTWEENALRANILAITSFALNRVYTEFYRSRGYAFDITSSTAFATEKSTTTSAETAPPASFIEEKTG